MRKRNYPAKKNTVVDTYRTYPIFLEICELIIIFEISKSQYGLERRIFSRTVTRGVNGGGVGVAPEDGGGERDVMGERTNS
jgi:hypothetical protein